MDEHPTSGGPQPAKPRAPAPPPPPRVLIVDDDDAQLLLMGEALRQRGFEIAEARDGAAATAAHKAFAPDLVLLDIEMPEMDGFAACASIRREADADLPIIMVTGLSDADSIHRAFAAGATDFIIKPINWALFQHRVAAILRTARSRAPDGTPRPDDNAAPDLALVVARNGVILEQLGRQILSVPAGATLTLADVWPNDVAAVMRQRISGVLRTRGSATQQFAMTVGGDRYRCEATFLPQGRDRTLVVVRRLEAEVERDATYKLAYYDQATGLPNRHLFERRLEEFLAHAALRERRGAVLAITFNRLGGQDHVEQTGRLAELMRAVGELLSRAAHGAVGVEALDNATGRAARVGSQRFAVLVADVPRTELLGIARALGAPFVQPITVGEDSFRLAPSIGIAVFPDDGRSATALLNAAQEAAEEARIGDGHRFYSESAHVSTLKRVDLASELRWAVDRQQLKLHFQPRVRASDSSVTAVEALLRWEHPLRGLVPLEELLPLAEATGMIVPIGEWVLRTACAEIGSLPMRRPQLAINLSPQEFAADELPQRIAQALDAAALKPEQLELEITERALRWTADAPQRLERLKKLGITVWLDGFGAERGQLATLKDFALDGLKIDAAEIHGAAARPQDQIVSELIIAMAQRLGLRTAAIAVETPEQAARLKELGCAELQGFLYSHPLPIVRLGDYLLAALGRG